MRGLNDIKIILMTTLENLGYTPVNLIVKSLDTKTSDGDWLLKGEFKSGFIGDPYHFEIKYNPTSDGITKCDITGGSSYQSGYA